MSRFQEIKSLSRLGLQLLNDQLRALWWMKTGGNGMFEEIKNMTTPLGIKKLNDQLRALWKIKGGDDGPPAPVLVYNGVGAAIDQWVVVVFNKDISKENLKNNVNAFTVTGLQLGSPVTYKVLETTELNHKRVAVKITSFERDDGILTVKYDKSKGNIQGLDGQIVDSFTEPCYITGLMPKAHVKDTVIYPKAPKDTVAVSLQMESQGTLIIVEVSDNVTNDVIVFDDVTVLDVEGLTI